MTINIYNFVGEMNLKLDGVERSNAVQELTKTFQEIMVSSVGTFIN